MPNELYEFIDKCKAGNLPLDEQLTMKHHHFVRDVLPLIKADGDFGVLCDMVKANPRLLIHPVVWHIIEYLKAHAVPWDSTADAMLEYESAQGMLCQIVTASMQRALPGYSVQPPKRQGRKLGWGELQQREILITEYKELLRLLQNRDVTWPERADDEAAHGRLEKILVSTYDEWQPPPPPSAQKKSLPKTTTYPYSHKPLTREKVRSWLKQFSDDLGTNRHRDYLAYFLLGHQYDLTPDQVRGNIQRQRNCQRTEYLP